MAPRDVKNLVSERITPLIEEKTNDENENIEETKPKLEIVWRNVLLFAYLHLAAVYGLYLCFVSGKWQTIVFAHILYVLGGIGITGGAHRLWSHRSYKAKWPLRVILFVFNTIAFQNDIYEWVRDHRVHHKYTETDADPHNATRGFFFSHVGWLLCRKHPLVAKKGKTIDCSDVYADPIVRFQKKYYLQLVLMLCFIMPTMIPNILWGESLWNSFFICGLLRYAVTLNGTWLVNSAAHLWGDRPYDKNINPSENIGVSLGAMGEGFHNYHHVFPYDYAASEWGTSFNITTAFIRFFSKIGWAYDLRSVPKETILQRMKRTGALSHSAHEHIEHEHAY